MSFLNHEHTFFWSLTVTDVGIYCILLSQKLVENVPFLSLVLFSQHNKNISVSTVRMLFTITVNLEGKSRCYNHHQHQHHCTCAELIFSSTFVGRIFCREKKTWYLWEFSISLPHLKECISFLLYRKDLVPLWTVTGRLKVSLNHPLLRVSGTDQISTLGGLLWHNLN